MISCKVNLADHGEDLIGGWVHRQDNYSPPAKTHINGESGQDEETESKSGIDDSLKK